jgi:hypothetical protein
MSEIPQPTKQARVPGFAVKDKEIDYDREILSILGHGVCRKGWTFAPPSLGVWSLWEIIDSPIIKGDANACIGDYWRLLFINHARRDAVSLVAGWIDAGKPNPPQGDDGLIAWKDATDLDRAVIKWASKMESVDLMSAFGEVRRQVELCFSGYEMIPSAGNGSGKYLFAGEAYGHVCSADPADYDRLIWDVPLVLIGHVTAQNAVKNGCKCARPKDKEDMKLQLALANEREARGELHQWQRDNPEAFQLSSVQLRFPALVEEFTALLKSQQEASKCR